MAEGDAKKLMFAIIVEAEQDRKRKAKLKVSVNKQLHGIKSS